MLKNFESLKLSSAFSILVLWNYLNRVDICLFFYNRVLYVLVINKVIFDGKVKYVDRFSSKQTDEKEKTNHNKQTTEKY